MMPQMMGNKVALDQRGSVREGRERTRIAYGMGITAEKVAAKWKVSREDQDAFAVASHRRP
jgi:acetyl-CoA acyltransferase